MQTHTRSVYRFLGMLAVLGWQTASAVEVSWYRQPGSALHIASNASASLWIVGTDRQGTEDYTNGYNVYKWNGTEFVKGNSFCGPNARSHHHGPALGGERSKRPGHPWMDSASLTIKARDIAVGADNSVWIIGTDQRAGGYGVYQSTARGFLRATSPTPISPRCVSQSTRRATPGW